MMHSLADGTARNAIMLIKVSEQFTEITGAEHNDKGFTSSTTQNN